MDRFNRGFHRLGLVLAVPTAVLWTVGAILLWVSNGPPDDVLLYGVISVLFGPVMGLLIYLAVRGIPRALRWVFCGFMDPT
jgi:hypothetical protein